MGPVAEAALEIWPRQEPWVQRCQTPLTQPLDASQRGDVSQKGEATEKPRHLGTGSLRLPLEEKHRGARRQSSSPAPYVQRPGFHEVKTENKRDCPSSGPPITVCRRGMSGRPEPRQGAPCVRGPTGEPGGSPRVAALLWGREDPAASRCVTRQAVLDPSPPSPSTALTRCGHTCRVLGGSSPVRTPLLLRDHFQTFLWSFPQTVWQLSFHVRVVRTHHGAGGSDWEERPLFKRMTPRLSLTGLFHLA